MGERSLLGLHVMVKNLAHNPKIVGLKPMGVKAPGISREKKAQKSLVGLDNRSWTIVEQLAYDS
jgi:hypothetical protein